MADEATNVPTMEQVSVCVRYVCVKGEFQDVHEEFLGYTSVLSTGAEVINNLKHSGPDVTK